VPSQKFGVHLGEPTARLARRDDDDLPVVFRGGPSRPASSRAVEIVGELLRRHTRVPGQIDVVTSSERFAAPAEVARYF
jgi:hypothetical protein